MCVCVCVYVYVCVLYSHSRIEVPLPERNQHKSTVKQKAADARWQNAAGADLERRFEAKDGEVSVAESKHEHSSFTMAHTCFPSDNNSSSSSNNNKKKSSNDTSTHLGMR